MAKAQRHDAHEAKTPDSSTPPSAPVLDTPPQMAMALARRSGSGKTAPSRAIAADAASAAPAPSANRAASSTPRVGASPAAIEASPKAAIPTRNARRRPTRSATRAPSSSRPLNDSPNAVLTSANSPSLNPRSRWIAGSSTEITPTVRISVPWTVASSPNAKPVGRVADATARESAPPRPLVLVLPTASSYSGSIVLL